MGYHRASTVQDAIKQAEYIHTLHATIRQTAFFFDTNKSTVHRNVTDVLRAVDPELYNEVTSVLQFNKRQRGIRGGHATAEKYRRIREDRKMEEGGLTLE